MTEITGGQFDGLPTGGIDRHPRPTPGLSFFGEGLELKNQRLLFRHPGGIDAELQSGGRNKAGIWKIRLGSKVATRHCLDLEHASDHPFVTDTRGYPDPFEQHSLGRSPTSPQSTGLIEVLQNLAPGSGQGANREKEQAT